jgi:predicted Zn-dependent peptidase
MPAYNEPLVTQFTNGLTLVSLANSLLNTSAIGFEVGTRNDPVWCNGLAHWWEHMLCRRSTEHDDALVNLLMRRHFGGSDGDGIKVCTTDCYMLFGHADLMRRRYLTRDVFPMTAAMVRDGMYALRRMRDGGDVILTPHAAKCEKAAVHNETRRNDDMPDLASYKMALQLLYTTSQHRNFGDCHPGQLRAVKLGRAKQWAQGQFVPSKMTVVMMGPTQAEAVRMVRAAGLNELPSWPASVLDVDRNDITPNLSGVRSGVLMWPKLHQTHVRMLWPVLPFGSDDDEALQVLCAVLKDRIEQAQREDNEDFDSGVYHPAVEWDASSTHGHIDVWFATVGNRARREMLVDQVLRVIRGIANDTSTAFDQHVDAARRREADEFLEAYRYVPSTFAEWIVAALAGGDRDLSKFKQFHRTVLRVTPKMVRAAAAKWLPTDRFVRVAVERD